ncbi:hypothetical protein SAMN06265222_101981 [Neorhodopirellula lusitana]|uniref:Uncharacterized protein n=1 Tax=Neorhodopirellula lusitana TaxID=445327 RepID=A0ABY1PSF6_9BACT|nr:hypothetical protein SAMN06265222_101981 [Neorhodopirellula lusitana]
MKPSAIVEPLSLVKPLSFVKRLGPGGFFFRIAIWQLSSFGDSALRHALEVPAGRLSLEFFDALPLQDFFHDFQFGVVHRTGVNALFVEPV